MEQCGAEIIIENYEYGEGNLVAPKKVSTGPLGNGKCPVKFEKGSLCFHVKGQKVDGQSGIVAIHRIASPTLLTSMSKANGFECHYYFIVWKLDYSLDCKSCK